MTNITKMAIMAIMGLPYIDKHGQYWCHFEEQQKCRSQVKTVYKMLLNLWPFPLNFWLENGHTKAGTSHESSELIFMFLESGEQMEWD